MGTFIFFAIGALAIETARRYWMSKHGSGDLDWLNILSLVIMASVVIPAYFVWNLRSQPGYVGLWWCGAMIAECIIYHIRLKRWEKEADGEVEKGSNKDVTFYFGSMIAMLVVFVVVSLFQVHGENKVAEQIFEASPVLVVTEEPMKTIVGGTEHVLLKVDGLKDKVDLSVGSFGYDVLELKKDSEIKKTKYKSKDFFEIVKK